MSKIKSFIETHFHFPDLVRRLLLSWLSAAAIEYFLLPKAVRDLTRLNGLAKMSLPRVLLLTVCFVAVLFALSFFRNTAKAERWGIAAVFALLAVGTLIADFSLPYLIACIGVLLILTVFALLGWQADPDTRSPDVRRKPKKLYLWITVGLSAAFFLFVCAWTVSRLRAFNVSTYDFGIFAQMFHYMRKTGLPLTTLERDGLLSHFAVHVSPIYYLLLPFYCLIPTPATLQVLQALVITSAVIPLWKIGKHHGLSEAQRMLLCLVLLLFPAFSGGTSYDIHENCFLTPLILWTLYGIDKRNTVLTAIAALLTLAVKEDAAVYVAVIALWLIVKTLLRRGEGATRDLLTGILMLAASVGWFLLVTDYLATSGDGVMTYRYDNFMYESQSSLLTVVKAVLMSPMKGLFECADPEKVKYVCLTLLPLFGLPFLTRRFERYILLIPYLLINLMSDYLYQYDVFFQYSFGSTALLLYLTAVNLADFKTDRRRILSLTAAALIGAGCFCTVILPVGLQFPRLAVQYGDIYQGIRTALDTVPPDASVTATGFYIPHLSNRDVLYDLRNSSKKHMLETEFIVMDTQSAGEYTKYASPGKDDGLENLLVLLENHGYREYGRLDNVLVIYRKVSE